MAGSKKKALIGSVLALIILCVPGYFGWRFLSIAYHRYEMGVAYWRIPKVERAQDDYETHRAALIKLGYFTKHQYYLKRITTRSQEFGELMNNLQAHFPTKIGKIEGHGYIYGEPTFLVVWAHSTQVKEIESFIQHADENEPPAAASSN